MECTLHLECTWSGVGVCFYWWVIWLSPWSGILVYTYDIRSAVGVYTPVGVATEWLWSVHSKLECTLRQGKGILWYFICFMAPFSLYQVNPSPSSAAYMRHWTGSSLVQVMACLLAVRRQAITWTNAGLLSIGLLGVGCGAGVGRGVGGDWVKC